MKQKILDIIDDKINVISIYDNPYIDGRGIAADEIAQMMCDELALNMWACDLHKDSIKISLDSSGFTTDQIDNALNKLK